MGRLATTLLLACALLVPGCVTFELPSQSTSEVSFPTPPAPPASGPDPRDVGDIILDPPSADFPAGYAAQVAPDGPLAGWIADLNAQLALPRDLHVQHATCGGEANAWYDPDAGTVTVCAELLDQMARTLEQNGLDPSEAGHVLGSTWLFVLFHELGHGLVHTYGLPITGREEDAVDELATVTLIRSGASDAAVDASLFWALSDPGAATSQEYADEHSLNAQRFYGTLCTVYGSDPQRYDWLVTEDDLPRARAARCPAEYHQQASSWGALLAPWTKAIENPRASA